MEQTEHILSKGESFLLIGKLALGFFGILAIIYILTELTPKIAKWIDKKRGKPSELIRYDDPEHYTVKSLFDADRGNTTTGNEENENGEGEETR
ncbi:MAG: hypothetical protein E7501_01880 [Ruminococcus sp.]|nr:hypothetical protein [Ruminococcus sp.]MBQ8904759.1 hypothetical protein [Ruminococcus sp.]